MLASWVVQSAVRTTRQHRGRRLVPRSLTTGGGGNGGTTTSSTTTTMENLTAAAAAAASNGPMDTKDYHDFTVQADLFEQYATTTTRKDDGTLEKSLNVQDLQNLLKGIGQTSTTPEQVYQLFQVADVDKNGTIDLQEFLQHSNALIGQNPARIILVVGGPGSGKGLLSQRLQKECNVIHLSSGDLLRHEIQQNTQLGRQVKGIIERGELVSSAIMVALMKERMSRHPRKRVLLDGFPRSLENAHDLVTLCGRPELALHIVCDDTDLLSRMLKRREGRLDDNLDTALQRLRTYHQYHPSTLQWLREQHVPILNLDGSGTPESVWQQLVAIGRLMRPVVQLPV